MNATPLQFPEEQGAYNSDHIFDNRTGNALPNTVCLIA